jgi:hypothetical protein
MHTTVTRRRRGARRPHRAPYGAYGLAPACAIRMHRSCMCAGCTCAIHVRLECTSGDTRRRAAIGMQPVSAANHVATWYVLRALALGAPIRACIRVQVLAARPGGTMHVFGHRYWPRAPAAACMYLGTGTGRAPRRLCDDGELDVSRRHQASSGDDGELDARLRLDELTPLGEILETMISDHLLSR